MLSLRRFLPALLAGFLAACASQRAAEGPQNLNDPFESVNRTMFTVSLAVDKMAVRPVAYGYRYLVPPPIRNGLRNVLNNLNSPVILANDLLQGEMDRAGTTLVRAGINSTIGVGGLIEVAEDMGYPRHSEDFGQTLGTYGVNEGPYIFLPLIGPGNPRDIIGRVGDFFFDPLSYVQWGDEYYVPIAQVALDTIDLRERNLETLDDVERSSADMYASLRSLYRQTRNNEIKNGETAVEDLPDF